MPSARPIRSPSRLAFFRSCRCSNRRPPFANIRFTCRRQFFDTPPRGRRYHAARLPAHELSAFTFLCCHAALGSLTRCATSAPASPLFGRPLRPRTSAAAGHDHRSLLNGELFHAAEMRQKPLSRWQRLTRSLSLKSSAMTTAFLRWGHALHLCAAGCEQRRPYPLYDDAGHFPDASMMDRQQNGAGAIAADGVK